MWRRCAGLAPAANVHGDLYALGQGIEERLRFSNGSSQRVDLKHTLAIRLHMNTGGAIVKLHRIDVFSQRADTRLCCSIVERRAHGFQPLQRGRRADRPATAVLEPDAGRVGCVLG